MNEPLSPLCWDATYELVLALMARYPHVAPDTLGLEQLKAMIVTLPGFDDDPALAHHDLLCEILRTWYEEAAP